MDIEALNGVKSIRYIELSPDELEQKMKELNDDRYKKQQFNIYHSKNRNGINQIAGSSKMIDGVIEHHLIINPHIINQNEQLLIQRFRKWLIRFYKKSLGQYFYKQKDKQFILDINVEYGILYQICGEKHTHLDIVIQHSDAGFLEQFHQFMEEHLRDYYPNLEYTYKLVNTSTYRKHTFNYGGKEQIKGYGMEDFCYSSPNTTLAYKKAKEEQNRLLEQKIAEIEAKQKVQLQNKIEVQIILNQAFSDK